MERIPAHAEVEHQAGADAIVVLEEQAAKCAAPGRVFAAALDEAIDSAQHEIGPRIAAVARPAEAEVAILPERIDQIHLHLHQIAADRDLMSSLDPVQAVGEVEILTIEMPGMSGADAEVSGYR